MIEELTKAARIASDKGGLPIMAAVLVRDGTITAGNGAVSINVPCPDLAGHTFAVDAGRFLAAVKASDGSPKLKLTDKAKLSVTHGKFRALIPLMDADNYPVVDYPESGESCPRDFIKQLRRVAPFIATDKSRPWATGAMLNGAGSAAIIATRQLLAAANRGKTASVETRLKMSATRKGRVALNKGVPHTLESRKKMALAQAGRRRFPCSEETKKKISEAKRAERNAN